MTHVRPDRLADFARGRLSVRRAAAVEQHVGDCDDCRLALARVRSAHEAMREVFDVPVPDVGTVRGEATVRWSRLAPAARVRRPLYAFAGLAAAAAVALLWWNGGRPEARLPGPVARLAHPLTRTDRLEAVVTLVGGAVQMRRQGRAVPLDPRATLHAADWLTTAADARVAAQWGEGTGFLLLLGGSDLALDRLEPSQAQFALGAGQVDVRRGPHSTDNALIVQTPGHVVAAHGTWFMVAASSAQTTVTVVEGVVEVTDREDGTTTVMTAPSRAAFSRGRFTKLPPLRAREAAEARAASEMNLGAWRGVRAALDAAMLDVQSTPSGMLAVDGVEMGPTPLDVRRPLGRHYVEISRPDSEPVRRWITLGGAEPGELRLALPPRAVAHDDSAPIEIEAMVRARSTQIRACYERRLKRDPTLAGTVTLRLRVGEAGQVRQATVEESTLEDPAVGECLRREASGWSFKQGRNATVVYPFVFRSQ